MTPEQIKARCEQIVHNDYDWRANNDLGWLTAQIALACREAIAKGLEMAAEIANGGGFITDTSAEARFGRECAGAIRRKAARVKETPCDTSSSNNCVEGR